MSPSNFLNFLNWFYITRTHLDLTMHLIAIGQSVIAQMVTHPVPLSLAYL